MKFRMHQHCLLPDCLAHEQAPLDRNSVRKEVIARKAFLARYTTGITLTHNQYCNNHDVKEWWFCIKDTPIEISDLTAKQRYRINRGLKNNIIELVGSEEEMRLLKNLVRLHIDSLEDYPKVYKKIPTEENLERQFRHFFETPTLNLWVCSDRESGEVTGYAMVSIDNGKVASLSTVKVPTRFLKSEVNAALAYTIVKHYINDLGFDYIIDGERNIRHITNYQDFLVKNLNFRYAYTELKIVYHPLIKPIISILYPMRKLIEKIGRHFSIAYQISCILKQEEIARTFK